MTTTTSELKYNPQHSDYENEEFYPTTTTLTYNQVMDIMKAPFVSLAADTLANDIYLCSGSGSSFGPICVVEFQDFDEILGKLEKLEANSIINYFSIPGELFGSQMMAWDVFREDVGDKRSEGNAELARTLDLHECSPSYRINYKPETIEFVRPKG